MKKTILTLVVILGISITYATHKTDKEKIFDKMKEEQKQMAWFLDHPSRISDSMVDVGFKRIDSLQRELSKP